MKMNKIHLPRRLTLPWRPVKLGCQ